MRFSEADYALINLGTCIKGQADRLGIEHEGVPLEGVVVRIAQRAADHERAAAEKGWDEGVRDERLSFDYAVGRDEYPKNPYRREEA